MRRGRCGARTLVEVALVGLLLVAAAAFLVHRYTGAGTPDRPAPGIGAPVAAAKGAACRANLRSVRQAVEAYRAMDPDGHAPGSLDALALPAQMLHCAEGAAPYVYDAAQPEVRCPYPGHETF